MIIASSMTIHCVYAHSIPLNTHAVKACESKARSASCQYEGGHNDLYIGTCQYMSSNLLCVRNQPIKKIKAAFEQSKLNEKENL